MAILATGTRLFANSAFQWQPTGFTTRYESTAPVAWNASDKNANFTLSNADQTATLASGALDDYLVRATVGYSTGKRYFEINVDAKGAHDPAVGMSVAGANLQYWLGNENSDSFAIYADGHAWFGGVDLGVVSTFTTGDRVCFAVNLSAKLFWVRVNGGSWNAGGTANPATGVGGFSYTTTGTMFPAANAEDVNDAFTAKFSAGSFAQAIPADFTAWDFAVYPVSGALDATDALDTAAITGSDTAVLAATDAIDVAAFTGSVASNTGTLAATEASDTAAFTGSDTAVLAATEAGDSAAFTGFGAAITWDSGQTSSSITLSNGSLTATLASGEGGDRVTKSTFGYSTGKKYLEVNIDVDGLGYAGNSTGTGFTTAALGVDTFIGGAGPAAFSGSGHVYDNGSSIATVEHFTASNRVCVAIDLDSKLVWFRTDGGNWNNSGTANPATATGGITYTTSGTLLVGLELSHVGDAVTLKLAASQFAQTAPAGFSAWDPAVISGPNGALVVTEAADTAAITGSDTAVLAATETGDTPAFTGTVTYTGTLAATEASDTPAVTGSDTALLAATEAADTPAFTGTVTYTGTLAATEAADAAAITGSDTAQLAATEASDVLAATGTVTYTGTLAFTSNPDNASFTGSDSAVLAATEASDTAALTGTVTYTGTLAATGPADTASFTGTITSIGTLAATDVGDTAALAGTVAYLGALAATESGDTAAITGSISAVIDVTDAPDVASLDGTAAFVGSLAANEDPDVYSVTGAGSAVIDVTDAPDVADITGSDTALLAATESADASSITGTVAYLGSLAATDTNDTAALAGSVPYEGTLAASEAPDVSSLEGTVAYIGTLAVTGPQDVASFSGSGVTALGPLAATEASDSASLTGADSATLAYIENPDNAFITGGNSGVLAATEPSDSYVMGAGNTGTLAIVSNPDNAFFTGTAGPLAMVLAATEPSDSASLTGSVTYVGALDSTEASDSASLTGTVTTLGTMAAAEASDTAALSGASANTGTLAATDARDTVLITAPLLAILAAIEHGDICLIQGDQGRGPLWYTAATIVLPQPVHVRIVMTDSQLLLPTVDLRVERGNNLPIVWELLNGDSTVFDISDSEFVLTLTFQGGQIVKQTGVDFNFTKDVVAGSVTYTPTLPESRMARPGRVTRYELERRHASAQRVLMAGDIIAAGGDNVD